MLESEIPADRAAATISRMLEATRTTAHGTIEQDWTTVEAGLRLYHEFMQHGNTAGAAFRASSYHDQDFALAMGNMEKYHRRKHPLSRVAGDGEALQHFMFYTPVEGADGLAVASIPSGSEFEVRWRQHREPEPDPFESVSPAVARKRDYRLAILSSVAIAGFLGMFGVVFSSRNQSEVSLQKTTAASENLTTRTSSPVEETATQKPAPTGIAAFSPRFETKMW